MKKMYLLAALSALVCGFLMYMYLGSVKSDAALSGEKTAVLVTAQDIPAYTDLTQEMFTVKELPVEGLHADAVTSFDQIEGKKSSSSYLAGEVVLQSKFGTEVESMASYHVPEGMRVMTVPVESASGLAQSLSKGDLVDVMFSAYDQKTDQAVPVPLYANVNVTNSVTTMILESVEVFTTGTFTTGDSEEAGTEYSTVSLLLTPRDCLRLYASQNYGTFSFVLRGHNETEPANPGNVAAVDIIKK